MNAAVYDHVPTGVWVYIRARTKGAERQLSVVDGCGCAAVCQLHRNRHSTSSATPLTALKRSLRTSNPYSTHPAADCTSCASKYASHFNMRLHGKIQNKIATL